MRKFLLWGSLLCCFWFWAAAVCQDQYTAAILWMIWPGIVVTGNIIRERRR